MRYLAHIGIFFLFMISACGKPDPCEENPQACFEDQLEKDLAIIEDYIEENELTAFRHPSGLHFIVNNSGDADTAKIGQLLTVDYIGRLIADGSAFDTSIDSVARAEGIFNSEREYTPFNFELGIDPVIEGWQIGLQFFEEGSEGMLLIPSYLAYGEEGSGDVIPPNSVLLFEIKLLNVRF